MHVTGDTTGEQATEIWTTVRLSHVTQGDDSTASEPVPKRISLHLLSHITHLCIGVHPRYTTSVTRRPRTVVSLFDSTVHAPAGHVVLQ